MPISKDFTKRNTGTLGSKNRVNNITNLTDIQSAYTSKDVTKTARSPVMTDLPPRKQDTIKKDRFKKPSKLNFGDMKYNH